jgi:erythromycin esterase
MTSLRSGTSLALVLAMSHAAIASPAQCGPGGDGLRESAPVPTIPGVVPLAGTEPPPSGALRGTGPAARPSADLAALAGWLGEAKVVGLGESVHGSHTLHRLTHRVFAHLAAQSRFDVLALEIDQAHAALLDAWVQGEHDDLAAVLAERWWGSKIFYDQALVELLGWMRAYNRGAGAGRRLHVAGYDVKQPALSARAVVEALARVDPKAAGEAATLYARALAPGAFGTFPNVWGFTGTLRIALPARDGPVRVVVELEARAEGVTYGSVGVAHAPRGSSGVAASWVQPGDLDAAWRTVRRDLEVPAGDDPLELVIWHRGNGTFEVTAPRVIVDDRPVAVDLATVEPRPLMMPRLQVMDHRAEVVAAARSDRPVLRVRADPALDASRAAAAAAEGLVREVAARAGDRLPPGRRVRILQAARLVTQAVEWRTLVEPNRDVFLAENLTWLGHTAYPESRILALGHVSHTERRAGRMGSFLAAGLGDRYRTVSMVATSGRALYFGEVSGLTADAELEVVVVEPSQRNPLEAALARLDEGSFLLPLAELASAPGARQWLESVHPRPAEAPDVVIRVATVEPLRAPEPR